MVGKEGKKEKKEKKTNKRGVIVGIKNCSTLSHSVTAVLGLCLGVTHGDKKQTNTQDKWTPGVAVAHTYAGPVLHS